MWLAYWLRDNWMALVSVLLAVDAERRLYCGLDWSLTKSSNDGWVLRNEGWLPERNIVIEPSHGVYYDGRRGFTLKHHESEPIVITVSEAAGRPAILVTSRRFLRRRTRRLALTWPASGS